MVNIETCQVLAAVKKSLCRWSGRESVDYRQSIRKRNAWKWKAINQRKRRVFKNNTGYNQSLHQRKSDGIRILSPYGQRIARILPLNKDDVRKRKNTNEDQIPPPQSLAEKQTPAILPKNDQIPSQKTKGKDLILLEMIEDEKFVSIEKDYEVNFRCYLWDSQRKLTEIALSRKLYSGSKQVILLSDASTSSWWPWC